MNELSEPRAAIVEQPAADATAQFAHANNRALDWLFGAQKGNTRGNRMRWQ
ncbi:hypothetical protein [Bradyrhizobium erythrophlei]|uniref:Uncharacterized protein n=1 Tax=Bradyrhizobium erythrophlei TaxID=1437360 RepID=A0A1M5WAY8_9BRAD|nr:hypothetical protein [Bradyrhizobium erythrophlei]SHH84588.1 hypothetical protein SAMN05443248_6454 [Bradyrhizobium erythrophlei]